MLDVYFIYFTYSIYWISRTVTPERYFLFTRYFRYSTATRDNRQKTRYIYIYCETQPSSIQRLSSIIFPCLSSFVVVRTSRMVTSPLYDVLDHTNHTFSESYWSKDIKTNITKCLMHKYTNTNTQIHKYSIWRSARKTQHPVYSLKKGLFKGIKNYIPICQMRKCKVKCQRDPTCGMFLKRLWLKDIKYDNAP